MTTIPDLKSAALAAPTLDIEKERREFDAWSALPPQRDWGNAISPWEAWKAAKASMLERLQVAEDAAKDAQMPARAIELIAKLEQWRYCMSYNDSYFGEPAGLVKEITKELSKIVDAIQA